MIQRAAAELVARGLARWTENPDHKRAYRLVVTEAGSALKAQADAQGLVIAERLAEVMELSVLEQAVSALHTVRGWLEADARGLSEGVGDRAVAAQPGRRRTLASFDQSVSAAHGKGDA